LGATSGTLVVQAIAQNQGYEDDTAYFLCYTSSGTFQVGETVTCGSISGVCAQLGTLTIYLRNMSGTFTSGMTITGSTSGAIGTLQSDGTPYTALPTALWSSCPKDWWVQATLVEAYQMLTRVGPAEDVARYQATLAAEQMRLMLMNRHYMPRPRRRVQAPDSNRAIWWEG
jgi:hypothetical protein